MGPDVTNRHDQHQHVQAMLQRITCLSDCEVAAQQCIAPDIWAYLNAGAADQISHRRNRLAFEQVELLPRYMRQATDGGTTIRLFGQSLAHPIIIAPMAYHGLAHPEGEQATALAAAAMQTPLVVSTQASMLLEDIAQCAPSLCLWFQLYLQADREVSLDLVRRAQAAGYKAIVVTVDAPIQGLRNEDQRHGFRLPANITPVNLARYTSQSTDDNTVSAGSSLFEHPLIRSMPGWHDLEWLAAQTSLPVLVKGLLNPLDVEPALHAGAAGIIVSNHGGRVLDTVPATLDALPGIAKTIKGRVPVLMDGGIRRGTDIVKALAMGASAIMLGRPVLHGLALAGAHGVAHVLNLLQTELEMTMVLCGTKDIASITPEVLFSRHNYEEL